MRALQSTFRFGAVVISISGASTQLVLRARHEHVIAR
jgi:hypothetical protein